jgi:hypothetical protein
MFTQAAAMRKHAGRLLLAPVAHGIWTWTGVHDATFAGRTGHSEDAFFAKAG